MDYRAVYGESGLAGASLIQYSMPSMHGMFLETRPLA